VLPSLLLLFSWKSGNVDKERERGKPLQLQWLLLVRNLVTIRHPHLLRVGEDDHGEETGAAAESITG